jgi:acetylornithine/N-succinyldiaminopimelate aminotransferase
MHGTTFGGGPLICAAALQVLTVIEKKNLLKNVRERGAQLRAGLEKLASRFDFIREVRGEGLIVGVDLSIDGTAVVTEALRQGLIINCTHEHIIRLLPAFIINRADVTEFLSKFERVLQAVSKASSSAAVSKKTKTETQKQPITLAASR